MIAVERAGEDAEVPRTSVFACCRCVSRASQGSECEVYVYSHASAALHMFPSVLL